MEQNLLVGSRSGRNHHKMMNEPGSPVSGQISLSKLNERDNGTLNS